jgi:ABC-type amino acid transport substrate-binding protein
MYDDGIPVGEYTERQKLGGNLIMKKLFAFALCLMLALSLTVAGLAESATPTIDAIKAKGKLIMMTNATFPPFEYIKDTKVAGIDADLSQMIADKLGVELEIMDMDFGLLIEALKGGKGDIVAAGMTRTDERAEQIDFSIIYVKNGLKVIVPAGSSIKTIADLEGKKIAVQESTTGDIWATDNIKGASLQQYKSAVEAGNAVANGKADASIMDKLPAESMVKNSGGKLMLLDEMAAEEDTAMGIAKGKEDLVALVNEVLQEAIDSGALQASIDKHMVEGAGD